MSYNKLVSRIAILLIVSVCIIFGGACNQNSLVSKVSIIPVPSFGKGIYRIKGSYLGTDLIWSPKEQELAGLITSSPLPLPDCPPSPWVCWLFGNTQKFNSEIFIVNLESKQRQVVYRTEKNEKIISRIFWLPDGQHIGYLIYDNSGNEIGTWSIDIQGQNDIQISQDSDYPIWSHDGSRIAIVSRNSIYIMDTSTNQKQRVFEAKEIDSYIDEISWSSDDKVLAFSNRKIYLLELATNKISQVADDPYEAYTHPEFSPKGNLIAFQRYQPSFFRYTTVIKDIRANCQIELPIELHSSLSWSPDGQELVVTSDNENYIVDLTEFIGPKFKEAGSICP